MTHRRKLLLGLLFIGLVVVAGAGWWWYARSPSLPIVLQGGSCSSDNLGVSGGNIVVAPKPGVLFGTVRKPGSQEAFTYLILFRYGRPKPHGSNQGQFHCTSDGSKAETKHAIELDGKRIEAAYRIELNQTRTAVANESLTIGGKSVEMTSGHVFLIDLTAEAPAYQQKKVVELPAIPSQLESTQDFEQLAEAIRKSLESQDPEIKAFLR
jgi:hypothetical protein